VNKWPHASSIHPQTCHVSATYLQPVARHPCVAVVDVVILDAHGGPAEPPGHRQVGRAQQTSSSTVVELLGCPVHPPVGPHVLDVEQEQAD
jgi:hypothetical protein